MLKKIGIPVLALAALVGVGAPRTAKAASVHFGVAIGAPVYTAPAPVYPYGAQYVDPYAPNYAPAYVAPAPYVAPYVGFGWGSGHDRDWDHHDRDHHDWGRREVHEGRGRR
jgi:hypothetical protein